MSIGILHVVEPFKRDVVETESEIWKCIPAGNIGGQELPVAGPDILS